jgi:hypothetical protein
MNSLNFCCHLLSEGSGTSAAEAANRRQQEYQENEPKRNEAGKLIKYIPHYTYQDGYTYAPHSSIRYHLDNFRVSLLR